MKHEVIKTDNYLLIVDESEIKEGDFCYDLDGSPGYKNNKFIVQCLRTATDSYWNKNCKKIIAHLPLNDSPILAGVPLLPPFSRHQEDGAEEYSKECNQLYKNWLVIGYKAGYNKAKEKYRFTEEDMRKAIDMARDIKDDSAHDVFTAEDVSGCTEVCTYGWRNRYKDDEIIQSISQPKMPIGFECQMVDFEVDMGLGDECIEYSQYPKTTTNSQGQTEWVGKWIY